MFFFPNTSGPGKDERASTRPERSELLKSGPNSQERDERAKRDDKPVNRSGNRDDRPIQAGYKDERPAGNKDEKSGGRSTGANRNRDAPQRNREEKWGREERSETVYRSDRNRNRGGDRTSGYKGVDGERGSFGSKAVAETKERSTNFEDRPPKKDEVSNRERKSDSPVQREKPEKVLDGSGGLDENSGKDCERKSGKSYLSKRRERQQEREERAAKEE